MTEECVYVGVLAFLLGLYVGMWLGDARLQAWKKMVNGNPWGEQ